MPGRPLPMRNMTEALPPGGLLLILAGAQPAQELSGYRRRCMRVSCRSRPETGCRKFVLVNFCLQ